MLIQTKAAWMAAIVLTAFFTCGTVSATPLGSNGSNLTLLDLVYPVGTPPPHVDPTYTGPTSGTFSATWTATTAASPWIPGTFTASDPLPTGTNIPPTTTKYDFTTLGTGTSLPKNTFFFFADVDSGSGSNETFYLTAYGPPGSGPITTPWLSTPVATWGGAGLGNPLAMPGWEWNSISHPDAYTIYGSSTANIGFNPNVAFALLSQTPISSMVVQQMGTNYGFGLAAPVPEPATLLLFGTGLLGLIRNGWRRQWAAD
jgi:hypothetical protein